MNGHAEKRVSEFTRRITWRATLYVDAANGGPRRETVGHYKTRAAALDAIDARKDEIRGGAEADARLTVSELLERYLADDACPRLAAKTLERYREIADELEDEFGDVLASRLRPATLQAWQTQTLERLAPATVRQYRAVLSGAYEWALSMGMVTRNPVRSVKAPTGRTKVQEAPSLAEAVAAVERCRGSIAYLPALLCLTCNLRRGEALALRWEDVDAVNGLIRVRASLSQTKDGGVFAKETKSGRERILPVPAQTVAELIAHHERQNSEKTIAGPGYADQGYVCARGDGEPLRPDSVSHAFDKRAHGMSLHDLRRAYATAMASRQLVDAEGLRDLLGHVDVRTTFGYYVRPVPEVQRAAVDAYGEALAKASGGAGHRMGTEKRLRVIEGGKR